MKIENSALRQMLAGEYALGALRGRARSRFERMIKTDAALRRLVDQWQEDLAPLVQETPAVAPSARVLESIQRRIDGAMSPEPTRLRNRLDFWRTFSFGSAAVAAVLAVFTTLLMLRSPPAVAPSYVAVLQDKTGQPVLVVTGYRAHFRLKTEPLALPAPGSNEVLQIWAIEKDTGALRALAPVPTDAPAQVALNDDAWKLVRNAHSLAVSIEPAGVAPTVPSSSLVYSGRCIQLRGG